MSGGCLGELKRLMDSQNPKYSKYDQTSDFLPVPPNHQNDLKWTKSSDPMYGGSNELFGRNKNFPLVSNIKLHLKMSVNYQLQISPPPTFGATTVKKLVRADENFRSCLGLK